MAVTIEQLPKQQKWRTTMNKSELLHSIAKEADGEITICVVTIYYL